ncbi:MAG: hypothetical protein JO322_02395 [Candidatus Eremiobacteraeota bacterium]|nr:hypothetical protein [Candidatus Eremiobacteraeota bacterium]
MTLPELPYDEWEPTKWTLHLWVQIVGKIRLRHTPHRNHWWNVPLYVTARGLTTRLMHDGNVAFQIDFDFIDNVLIISTETGNRESLALHDGITVQAFYEWMLAAFARLNLNVRIRTRPYGIPIETPFELDVEHRSYDADAVRRWWSILTFSAGVFEEFSGRFVGKTSPVHLFWHSFDLAVTRFSGRPAPARPGANRVEREAYSHEVISFGFWPGDPNTRFPAYYTYTAPEPAKLAEARLWPDNAKWVEVSSTAHLGVLPYDNVRESADPHETLLGFLQSGFDAGSLKAEWPAIA